MTRVAEVASAERFALGEGPVWDAARGRLLWVDIVSGSVLEGRLDGQAVELTRRHTFDSMVGAVAFAADGTLQVAILALGPGDLINTGPPPGVGMGFDPQVCLQPDDGAP